MVLQVLTEKTEETSFVLDLCSMCGITGAVDLAIQGKPLLLVLEILKALPEEHNRRDPGSARRERRPIKLLRLDSQTTVELVGMVLQRCDETLAAAGGDAGGLLGRLKLGALSCLKTWTQHTSVEASWVTLTDMLVWGVVPVLERQATMVTGPQALPAEVYAMVLQILTDGFRNHSFYGGGDPKAGGGGDDADVRKQAFRAVARIVLVMGQYVLQPGNAYADEEEVARSACDALTTLLHLHLAPLFHNYRDHLRGTPEGDAELSLVRELLQLLVQFTGHSDLSGVAEPPLELWYFLPELLDLQDTPTPEATAMLAEVVPSLVETIHRQCVAPAGWGEKEWGLAFMSRSSRKGQNVEDSGETDWDQFMDLIYFRTGANDVVEAMAANWPEKQRPGEVLFALMNRCSDNPLAVEAAFLCLTGVARGLQSMDYYDLEEEEEDDDEEKGDEDDDGGYYDEDGGGDDEAYMSEQAREEKRQEAARQRQPDLWLAVLQAITSLQDPNACFYLWRTACALIRELVHTFLMDVATPAVVEHVVAFLVRALGHRLTCSAAATSLKHLVHACCSSRGTLGAGKEAAIKQQMIGLLTGTLQGTQDVPQQQVLLSQPHAYASVVESVVVLILTLESDASSPALVEQLGSLLTSTLGVTTRRRGRADAALVLCGILAGITRGKGRHFVDTLLGRAWSFIEEAVFGPLAGQENPTVAVRGVCNVLTSILRVVVDKALFLPLVLAKVTPLVEFNGQLLEHYRTALLPTLAAQQRKASPEEMAGVVLWPAPIVFVRKVLMAGATTALEGWWPAFQQVVDAICRLTAQGLELKIGDEDEHGNQDRRQLLVSFYDEVFAFLKEIVVVAADGAPPTSLVAEDPYCVRRGLELAIVSLELPLENSGCLNKVVAYVSTVFQVPGRLTEAALQELTPRLLLALLLMLVSTINMPSNIKRVTADVLHVAIFRGAGGGGGGRGREALSSFLASQGQQQLQALFRCQDPAAVEWVRQSFLGMVGQPKPLPTPAFRDFIKCFCGLGRNEMTLDEVRQSVERNQASASIFPDL